jgi:hypothetical protein
MKSLFQSYEELIFQSYEELGLLISRHEEETLIPVPWTSELAMALPSSRARFLASSSPFSPFLASHRRCPSSTRTCQFPDGSCQHLLLIRCKHKTRPPEAEAEAEADEGAARESFRPSVDGKSSRQRSLKQQTKREVLLAYRNRFAAALKAELVRLLPFVNELIALMLSFVYNAYIYNTHACLYLYLPLYVHLYIDASLCYLNWDDCLLFFGLRRKS